MWIYGASGHGKVVLDCLTASGVVVKGYIDDDQGKSFFMDLPVLRFGHFDPGDDKVIIAIGDNYNRMNAARRFNFRFGIAIHPSAVVSPNSTMGEGWVVIPQAVINAGSHLGKHCIVNTRASVGHDSLLGDYVHVAPGATICGNVRIGSLTWVGAGATIIENITIGNNVMIGAGSVVVKDLPDNAFVTGNPARIMKHQNKLLNIK